MKKILFAAYSLDVGGIETALITLIRYLSDKYKITLVLEKKQGALLKDIPENVEIIEYKISNKKNVLFREIENFIKQIRFKLKHKNKFDFSASYATYSFPCAFIARCASKNTALWVHNNYMNFYNGDVNQYKNFFNHLRVDKFNKIIFVSEIDKAHFLIHFPEYVKKLQVCHNLIDYKQILEKDEEEITDFKKSNVTVFINIGRQNENEKKLSRIIDSTRRLNKEGFKFRVVFVGKGIDTKMYINMAKDLKNISFIGIKKNPYPNLKLCDCLIVS